MPRFSRPYAPGALVHVISRFVNRQYRLGPEERAALMDRFQPALERSDWSLISYAFMSNHIHLAVLAGQDPIWRWLKSLHTAWAKYLNRAHRTFGPVFAERATTIHLSPSRSAFLVAYIHNNPVRAGQVAQARESDWTSHRAWMDPALAPSWLDVRRGMLLAGLDVSASARNRFDEFVAAQAVARLDPVLVSTKGAAVRRQVRTFTRLPLEVSSAIEAVERPELSHELFYPGREDMAPMWRGRLKRLLDLVSLRTGIPLEQLCSPSRHSATVRARRLFLVTGSWFLRRELKELAAALSITSSAASHLIGRSAEFLPEARLLADMLRTKSEPIESTVF